MNQPTLRPDEIFQRIIDSHLSKSTRERARRAGAALPRPQRKQLRGRIMDALSGARQPGNEARGWLLSTLAFLLDADEVASKGWDFVERALTGSEFYKYRWSMYWTLAALVEVIDRGSGDRPPRARMEEVSERLSDLAASILAAHAGAPAQNDSAAVEGEGAAKDSADEGEEPEVEDALQPRGEQSPEGVGLVLALARAILAISDSEQLAVLQRTLERHEEHEWGAWFTLRALRIVPLHSDQPELFELLEELVLVKPSSVTRLTYDAVVAMGNTRADGFFVRHAADKLQQIIRRHQPRPRFDSIRSKAIIGLGRLADPSGAAVLLQQLSDDNPLIVQGAGSALGRTLGPGPAARRVVEELVREPAHLEGLASGLRSMNAPREVAGELEEIMLGADKRAYQDAARSLLSALGGEEAVQKLRIQRLVSRQHGEAMGAYNELVRDRFRETVMESKTGFRVKLFMDIVIFLLGVGLILFACYLIFIGDPDKVALVVKVFFAGGSGGASLYYSSHLRNARNLVSENVADRMRYNAIFQAFLRQMHQIDQAYIRALMESERFDPETTQAYVDMISKAADQSLDKLAAAREGKAKPAAES